MMNLPKISFFTDFYELTMAQGFFKKGMHRKKAAFDYFFRTLPFDGGYVIFAGLETVLQHVSDFRFDKEEIEYLAENGFEKEFLDFLATFSFRGSITSVTEGEIVFPNSPVLRVEGNLHECQLIETVLLNFLNFESLIATKASRLVLAANGKPVIDFGLRRAQGFGGIHASRAAYIGGVSATSNVAAAQAFSIPASGTMAHSWIQSFGNELDAFRAYAEFYKSETVLLVDTFNTLESGVPNAVTVGKELKAQGYSLKAIRLDSGDLSYLARHARNILDSAGLTEVKIVASNQLDEHLIKSLQDQQAPIDIFGVGTRLVTAYDCPALDGVYKMCMIAGKPTLKISNNIEKCTLPGLKKMVRFLNADGSFNSDGIILRTEAHPDRIEHPYLPEKKRSVMHLKSEEIQSPAMVNGERKTNAHRLCEIQKYAAERLAKLNPEHKRFHFPHEYKVGVSRELKNLQADLRRRK